MISLDQIQLLEQKVESAVAKILQLTEENQALSQRCVQLEEENRSLQNNILNFHQDQEMIEQGIIKALDKLNAVENSVLQAAAAQQQVEAGQPPAPDVQNTPGTQVAEEQAQQLSNNEQQVFNQVPPQAIQSATSPSGDDVGLAPMFSEEVIRDDALALEEAKPVASQNNGGESQQPQDGNLFVQNQDAQTSAQLDIF